MKQTFVKVLKGVLLVTIFFGALLGGSGCLKSSLAELVKDAGQNTNSISVKITTIYGTLDYQRNIQPK